MWVTQLCKKKKNKDSFALLISAERIRFAALKQVDLPYCKPALSRPKYATMKPHTGCFTYLRYWFQMNNVTMKRCCCSKVFVFSFFLVQRGPNARYCDHKNDWLYINKLLNNILRQQNKIKRIFLFTKFSKLYHSHTNSLRSAYFCFLPNLSVLRTRV